ncbi:MAG: ABC transporter permease [Candidatus Bipolaricaulota bacterium]|nr:ABC transporter permease [Candidatus Bipolaricaulota bacterium]MBS3792026.1 ABC transporter permease [Candidatus Bipolaricaulota bacterium]
MTSYIIRRLLVAIPTLLVVLTLVFLLVRVAPGDPATAVLGQQASREAIENLRTKMGLDKPLWKQYFEYLKGLVNGNLGKSLITRQPVGSQVLHALPYTLELTATGVVLGSLLGIPLGILTAVHRNAIIDYLGRIFSLAGLSIPAFYLGILLMMLFSIQLNLLPTVGGGEQANVIDLLYHLVLPGLTLGLIMTAYVTRMTRSSILNILNQDYVSTARSKGLKERVVIYKHILKNALVPILSVLGVYSIVLIGSSVMTEIVFSRPGLGKLMVMAMKQRDYLMLQSLLTVYAGLVVLINLMTDLSYGMVDPRVRYE